MGKKVQSLVNPSKKEKKTERVKPITKPPGIASFPVPLGQPQPTKSPVHAKWPAMFKRHIGTIEAHIRLLDRVMQSMHSHMKTMEPEERELWERGERGNWNLISGMMQRANSILVDARAAGVGVVSLQ